MISVMASNLTTYLMALDRFICIVWRSYEKYGFTFGQAIIGMCISYVFAMLLPLLALLISSKEIENAMCFPVGGSVAAIFSILYACIGITLLFIITAMYFAVMSKVLQSRKMVKSSDKTMNVFVRISVIVLSNFMASMTIAILSILSLFNLNVSASIEAMIAFLLFPLNSCLNPVLNTISTEKFIRKMNVLPWIITAKNIFCSNIKKCVDNVYKI